MLRPPPLLLTLLLTLVMYGCQSISGVDATRAGLVNDAGLSPTRLRQALLSSPDLKARLERLIELERQGLALYEHEPLKLGAIGSAILDLHEASLTGHLLLQRFYEHLDTPETAAHHRAWAGAIQAATRAGRSGSRANPFLATTPAEGFSYLLASDAQPHGHIYLIDAEHPALLMLTGQSASGATRTLHFDLSHLYLEARNQLDADQQFSPIAFIAHLARSGDSAAQTTMGELAWARGRTEDARNWLRAAAQTDNSVASRLLGRLYWSQAATADPDAQQESLASARDNYLAAIELGNAEAMYELAAMYLEAAFGENQDAEGLSLLRRAAGQEHARALLYLAHLSNAGRKVAQDRALAGDYFRRSAALGDDRAQIAYARFLMQMHGADHSTADPRLIGWLEQLAKERKDAQAMLLLGNLHARGIGTRQNLGRAYRWYRKAALTAPRDADVVNEVAWTLAVSDLERLRRARFANRIMSSLMEADTEARQTPEFLDTWAATFAATGDFDQAVRLQQMALQQARATDATRVLNILEDHLALFLAEEPVVEQAP